MWAKKREGPPGFRRPCLVTALRLDRLPHDSDLETVQALAAIRVLHLHEVHAAGEIPAIARRTVPTNFVHTRRGVLRNRLHEAASDVEDAHVNPTRLRRGEAN